MKKQERAPSEENLIGKKIAEAFGYGDEQLMAEYDRAAAEIADPNHQEPEIPEDTFDKIMARLQIEEEEAVKKRKIIRIERVVKTALLVSVLGAAILSSGVAASGKRSFEFKQKMVDEYGRNVIISNDDTLAEGYVEEAYQKIRDTLGIEVLQLAYVPKEMEFYELEINQGVAIMEFLYNGNSIYFVQSLYSVENNTNTVSDRGEHRMVHNTILGKDLYIQKNVVGKETEEYSTVFVNGKTYCSLEGIIEEEEFKAILRKIIYFEPDENNQDEKK